MVKHVIHANSNDTLTGGGASLPSVDDIMHGEIAINYHKENETLVIKNDDDEIVPFKSNNYYQKIFETKQDVIDYDLDTYAKTIVGAINENRRDAGAVREEIGSREVSLGDIIYRSAKNGLHYNISPDEWDPEMGTPVGVAVIPANHILGDRRARMISLYNVDSAGTASVASYSSGTLGIKWSEGLTDTMLPNYDQVPVLESNETNIILNTSPYGYLPLQYNNGTRLENATDTETSWFSTDSLYSVALTPSPYLNDGSFNENYYISLLNGSEDLMNPLSDFDGLKNTADLTEASGSFFTAAYAASQYKSDDDDNAEWYLPSMGELGYMGTRLSTLNSTLQKLNEKGGGALGIFPLLPKPGFGGVYWSSTEYSSEFACNLSTIDGRINDLRGKMDELSYLVRPFAIVELGEPILDSIDRLFDEKQDRVTDNLTTDSNEIEGAINELDSHIDGLSAYTINLDTVGQTVGVGEIISHVSQTDGLVKVEKRALTKEDIPTIEQNQVNNLPEDLQEIRDYISGLDFTISAETGYALGYVKQEDGQVTAYVKELIQSDIKDLPEDLDHIRNTISGFDFTLSAVTGEAIGYIKQEDGQVSAYVKKLIQDDIENLPEDLNEIRQDYEQLSADTHSKIDSVSASIETTINNLDTEIHQSLSAVSGSIVSYVEWASGNIETTINNLDTEIHQSLSAVSGGIVSYIDSASANIETTIENLSGGVITASANIETTINNLSGDVVDYVQNVSGYIENTIENLSGDVVSHVQNVSGYIRTYINNVSGYIETTIENLSGDVITHIKNVSGYIENTIEDLSGDVITYIKNVSGDIRQYITTVSGNIRSYINAVSGYIESTIEELSGGTIEAINNLDFSGVTAGTGNVVDSVKQVDGKVSATLRKLEQSDIPGLVEDLEELGQNITESYNNSTSYTRTAINDLDSEIRMAISGVSGNIRTYINTVSGNIKNTIEQLSTDTENAIDSAINALNITPLTAGQGKVFNTITETNGKVSATTRSLVITDISGLNSELAEVWTSAYTRANAYADSRYNAATSNTLTQINNLDSTVSAEANQVVTAVTQENGKLKSVGTRQLSIVDISGLSDEFADVWTSAYTRSTAYTMSQINALDGSVGTAGQVVTAITQQNGKITGSAKALATGDISGLNTRLSGIDSSISSLNSNKQDKLTAGTGISFSGDTISCTLNTNVFVVLSSLPKTPASGNEQKIHVIPSSTTGASDTYVEYIYVDSQWEKLGEFKPEKSIDLSSYALSSVTHNEIVSNYNAATAYTQAQISNLNSSVKVTATTHVVTAVTQANGQLSSVGSRQLGISDISGLNSSLNGKQKAIKAGDNITIATGTTADTISATVPDVSDFVTSAETNALVDAAVNDVRQNLKTINNIPITGTGNFSLLTSVPDSTFTAPSGHVITGISLTDNVISAETTSDFATISQVDANYTEYRNMVGVGMGEQLIQQVRPVEYWIEKHEGAIKSATTIHDEINERITLCPPSEIIDLTDVLGSYAGINPQHYRNVLNIDKAATISQLNKLSEGQLTYLKIIEKFTSDDSINIIMIPVTVIVNSSQLTKYLQGFAILPDGRSLFVTAEIPMRLISSLTITIHCFGTPIE